MKRILLTVLLGILGTIWVNAQTTKAPHVLTLQDERIDTDRTIDGAEQIIIEKGSRVVSPVRVLVHGCESIQFREGFTLAPGAELVAKVDTDCAQSKAAAAAGSDTRIEMGPNPSYGTVTLTLELADNMEVEATLYNMSGQKVADLMAREALTAGFHEQQTDLNHLPAGTYLYRIRTGQEFHTGRLIRID